MGTPHLMTMSQQMMPGQLQLASTISALGGPQTAVQYETPILTTATKVNL